MADTEGRPGSKVRHGGSLRRRMLVAAAASGVLLVAISGWLLGGRPTVRAPVELPSAAVHPTLDPGVRSVCPGALPPAGFAISEGVPHPDHAPYTPLTLFNPQSVANFAPAALNDTRNAASARRCLA